MLSGQSQGGDTLALQKAKALSLLHSDFKKFAVDEDKITFIEYPVLEYPQKIKSINFDTTDKLSGLLTGIKGQYLLFESGAVINLRKYSGYRVELEY